MGSTGKLEEQILAELAVLKAQLQRGTQRASAETASDPGLWEIYGRLEELIQEIMQANPGGALPLDEKSAAAPSADWDPRVQRLETLRMANMALSQSLNLGDVLTNLLDYLELLIPFDRAAVLLQKTATHAVLHAARGFQAPLLGSQAEPVRLDVRANTLLHKISTTRQGHYIADIQADPEWEHYLGPVHGRSWIGVPLVAGGELIGQYSLEKQEPNFFDATHLEMAESLAAQAAIAIQNARLFAAQRRHVTQLAALHATSLDITQSQDLPGLLATIVERAVRLLGAAEGGLYLCDALQRTVRCMVSYRTAIDHTGVVLNYGEGAAGLVAETGKPLIIDDYRDWQGRADVFEEIRPFTAVLSVPMRWKGEVTGVLHVLSDIEVRRFSQADQELLLQFANQAAIAIENARLFGAERQAHDRAESFRELTTALASSLNLGELLDNILEHLARVITYKSACVFLIEEQTLRSVAGRGFKNAEKVIGRDYPLDADDLYIEAANRNAPLILADAQLEPRFKQWGETAHVRGWMGVPLQVRGEMIGMLTIDSSQAEAYGPAEADLAQGFANQAAVAIENARLFDQVRIGRERMQKLSQQLLNVQENERRRIALELHDQIGQTLTAVKINLQTIQRTPEAASMGDRLEKSITIVERAVGQVRSLSLALRPSMLDDLGLPAALRWFVDRQAQQGGFDVDFQVDDFEERLDPNIETACFRVAQEALTNIMRHAEAGMVQVRVSNFGGEMQMLVEDDGVGFDVPAALERAGLGESLGILGMRERVQLLGGKLELKSWPGKGTKLLARFPITPTKPLERRDQRRVL
jgi:signal transduction histidine kinase